MMKTEECVIDTGLNKFIWSKGVKNVPYRVRVKISRKRHETEESGEKFYTTVEHVPVAGSYKGLQVIDTQQILQEISNHFLPSSVYVTLDPMHGADWVVLMHIWRTIWYFSTLQFLFIK